MIYVEAKDCYICKLGKELRRKKDQNSRTMSGFESKKLVYQCDDCTDCPYRRDCISKRAEHTQSRKTISYSPEFEKYRDISQQNITTPLGIDLRLNRSIQAERSFSKQKDGLDYDRFRHTGIKSIAAEMNLMALAININKLQARRMTGQTGVVEYNKAS